MVHMREKIELQLKAMNMAADKSAAILDERLERMNEFRAAMEDQGRRFVSREELELKLAVLVKDVVGGVDVYLLDTGGCGAGC
jgi:hypothetical protein